MSDASSDNSAEFKSFLANVRLLSVSPEVQEAESVLIDPSSVPQSVRLQSASPETQDWDSFLAAFSTSSAAVPTWPLVSEPPLCSSEDLEESRAVTTQPSDSESSSEGVEESTSADDYRPSPVIKPVLYKRPGSCSADEGVGDFLHTLGELACSRCSFIIFTLTSLRPNIGRSFFLGPWHRGSPLPDARSICHWTMH